MDAIADAAGVAVEYRVFDSWSAVLDALRDGRIDLVPDLGISDERRSYASFTRPLEVFAVAFFVRNDAGIRTPEELTGRRVGVVRANVAVKLLAGRDDLDVIALDRPAEAVQELMAGRIDAIAYPAPVLQNVLQELRIDGLVRPLRPALAEIKRAVAVSRRRPDLLARLGPATDAFVGGARYQQIYTRWFGEPRPFWSAGRVAMIAAVAIAAAILVLAAWRYISVRRLVRQLQAESRARRAAEEDLRELTLELEQRVVERTDALRQSEQRYRLVLDNLSAGAIVHASDTSIIYCNSVAESLLGRPRAQIMRATAADPRWHFVSRDNEPLALEDYPVMRVLASGRPLHDFILGVVASSDEEPQQATWLMISGVPITDGQGRISEVVITFVDLTEQLRLADQSRRMAHFDALGRLTAGVAHELNNPLMGIINGAQYCLSDHSTADDRMQVLRDVERHTQRCIRIVDSLLAFSRSGASPQAPFVEANVETLVGHVVRLLEYRIQKEGVHLTVSAAADLPPVRLQAEPFQQVLVNLLTNALDAVGEASDKTISVHVTSERDGLVVRVADHGSGMADSDRARVFEPFFTTKPAGKGTGLGLSTCWSIVHDHGGTIDVDSGPFEGTVVSVRLPLDPDAALQARAEAERPVGTMPAR